MEKRRGAGQAPPLQRREAPRNGTESLNPCKPLNRKQNANRTGPVTPDGFHRTPSQSVYSRKRRRARYKLKDTTSHLSTSCIESGQFSGQVREKPQKEEKSAIPPDLEKTDGCQRYPSAGPVILFDDADDAAEGGAGRSLHDCAPDRNEATPHPTGPSAPGTWLNPNVFHPFFATAW